MIASETQIATPFGYFAMHELARIKKPDERFLVYCWNSEKTEYWLGWAHDPRSVVMKEAVEIIFHDGKKLVATPNQLCFRGDETWVSAGKLAEGDELMAFHRIPANQNLTKIKINQFPRILTRHNGWMHERQFIDEWKSGKKIDKYQRVNVASKFIHSGLNLKDTADVMGVWDKTLARKFHTEGFSYKEICWLSKRYRETRRVVSVRTKSFATLYELQVDSYDTFATDSIMLKCGENNG